MQRPDDQHDDLRGRIVVITRPSGTAAAMVRQARARGAVPLLLPGLSLRAVDDVDAARAALRAALAGDVLVFTSPAAVHFAAQLAPLAGGASVLAVGRGTALALQRHGVRASAPARQDSEGLLDHPLLRDPRGRAVALIGAPGGRGLLRTQLAARGARLCEVHVYRRVPPRLDRRHIAAVSALPATARVLVSSAEALRNLVALLPSAALARLRNATLVASSERLAEVAAAAGFGHIVVAASALACDLLAAAQDEA